MGLSSDLISQFVKVTKKDKETKQESTVHGTAVKYNGTTWVKLDGSDLLTPVSTTTDAEDGERVTVLIKNHTATITGNISSPAARTETVKNLGTQISEFEIIIAYKMKTEDLEATSAIINSLKATVAKIGNLQAVTAKIETLEAKFASLEYVSAKDVEALNADIENLRATFGEFTDISTDDLEAANADVDQLKAYTADFTYVSADVLEAIKASVQDLEVKKLSAEDAMIKYANIDFSNIGQAAFEYLYSQSGLIENLVVGDGSVTGTLVGVTIRGDSIEANTIKADKLVVLGEDGLYYKLNFDSGKFTDAEEVPTDGLDGRILVAKSVTAEKVNVNDLVAFDATIGGFNITENSIYSEVKDSEENTTRGIYFDTDGQVNVGDSTNYIKYVRNDDGTFSLAISAKDILYSLNGTPHSLADLGVIGEYVHIGTFEDEPCIELGESDSEFKLLITNTRILFMEGSIIPAHFTNQSLHIKKAVIEEELQFGRFVWQSRANGNMGVVWKDEIAEVNL